MYLAHFNLKRDPFGMTPDPSLLFMTESHREALSGVTYAILAEKGFIVLVGEAGTGKTTILSRVLRHIPGDRAKFSVTSNPTLPVEEFLESVLIDFGITDIPSSKKHRLMRLQAFLTEAHSEGKTCVLVVDEAHKLSAEVLEEIRLLTNFENAERKLLQIVLAGQTELANALNREDLRQLKQRVAVRFGLRPLSESEVGEYMRFRWSSAGGSQALPFDSSAIEIISSVSRGVPRIVNAVSDNALVLAYSAGAPAVTAADARQAIRDLDLGRPDLGLAAPTLSDSSSPSRSKLSLAEPAERYLPSQRKPPILMRWAEKLRLANVERVNS